MQRRSFLNDMRGLSLETKQRILADGVVHNFMESADGAINGLPDLDADPQALVIVRGLDRGIDRMIKGARGIEAALGGRAVNGNGNNGHDHTPEPPAAAAEPEDG